MTLLGFFFIIKVEISKLIGACAILMKTLSKNRLSKKERELKVLLNLVELYISEGQPIGSKTLMEKRFKSLSSATIRNYFASLETSGFLSQQHASGGRIPTEEAYKAYAEEFLKAGVLNESKDKKLRELSSFTDKGLASYLQRAAYLLSEITTYPVFLSAPRFDQDFIIDIKLVLIDSNRCLCVVLTELGLIRSEMLYVETKLHHHALKRVEEVLIARIKASESTVRLSHDEEILTQKIYNEVMVRYIIGYSNFSIEEVYTTGLSTLLGYPEFNSAESFVRGLALFENPNYIRQLIKESCREKSLRTFIGSQLSKFSPLTQECSSICLPYTIGGKIVGAVGILGPMRMPYRDLFGILHAFTEYISTTLTKNMVKYKLTYRTPQDSQVYLEANNYNTQAMLEDKRH